MTIELGVLCERSTLTLIYPANPIKHYHTFNSICISFPETPVLVELPVGSSALAGTNGLLPYTLFYNYTIGLTTRISPQNNAHDTHRPLEKFSFFCWMASNFSSLQGRNVFIQFDQNLHQNWWQIKLGHIKLSSRAGYKCAGVNKISKQENDHTPRSLYSTENKPIVFALCLTAS